MHSGHRGRGTRAEGGCTLMSHCACEQVQMRQSGVQPGGWSQCWQPARGGGGQCHQLDLPRGRSCSSFPFCPLGQTGGEMRAVHLEEFHEDRQAQARPCSCPTEQKLQPAGQACGTQPVQLQISGSARKGAQPLAQLPRLSPPAFVVEDLCTQGLSVFEKKIY